MYKITGRANRYRRTDGQAYYNYRKTFKKKVNVNNLTYIYLNQEE